MLWLIDAPAQFIGSMAGPILGLVAGVAALALGILAGAFVARRLPLSLGNWGQAAGWLIGAVVFFYLGAVFSDARHYMAISTLTAEHSDDDVAFDY